MQQLGRPQSRRHSYRVPDGLPSTPSPGGQLVTLQHSPGRYAATSPTVSWVNTNVDEVAFKAPQPTYEDQLWGKCRRELDQHYSNMWNIYWNNHHSVMSTTINDKNIHLGNQLADVNAKKTELERWNVELQSHLANLNAKKIELEGEHAELQSQLQQAGQKSAEHRRRTFRFVIAHVLHLLKTQTLEGDNKAYMSRALEKQREAKQAVQLQESLNAELQGATQSIKGLVEERAKVRNSNVELQKNIDEARRARNEAEQQRVKAEEALKIGKSETLERVNMLDSVVQKQKSDFKGLEERNVELQEQIIDHVKSAMELESELEKNKNDLAAAEAQAASLKEELTQEQKQSVALLNERDELQQQVSTSTAKVGSLETALTAKEEAGRQFWSTMDTLRRKSGVCKPEDVEVKSDSLDSPTSPTNEQALSNIKTLSEDTGDDRSNASTTHNELTPPPTPHLSQTKLTLSSPLVSPSSSTAHSTSSAILTRPTSPRHPQPAAAGPAEGRGRIPLVISKINDAPLPYERLPDCKKKPGTEIKAPSGPNLTLAQIAQKRKLSSGTEASQKRRRRS